MKFNLETIRIVPYSQKGLYQIFFNEESYCITDSKYIGKIIEELCKSCEE